MAYLVGGGYEGQIIGYQLSGELLKPAEDGAPHKAPAPIFAFSAHTGLIRTVACSAGLLATGSTDNTLGCYNLRKRRFYGKLLQQDGGGAVACLRFFGESHLISAGEDGELCIWRTSDWECLTRMHGHKGAVHDVTIHPSGRLAISVAADKKLMLWNLTTGKCVYTSALAQPARMVLWTPAADAYVVGAPDALLVFELKTGQQLHALRHEAAPLAMAFGSQALLVSGGEEKALRAWDVANGACEVHLPAAHATRIKALARVAGGPVVASGSTDGVVKLWRVSSKTGAGAALQLLMEFGTRMRLTALTASAAPPPAKQAAGVAAAGGEEGEEGESEEEGEEEEGEEEEGEEEESEDEAEDELPSPAEEAEAAARAKAKAKAKAKAGGTSAQSKPRAQPPAAVARGQGSAAEATSKAASKAAKVAKVGKATKAAEGAMAAYWAKGASGAKGAKAAKAAAPAPAAPAAPAGAPKLKGVLKRSSFGSAGTPSPDRPSGAPGGKKAKKK